MSEVKLKGRIKVQSYEDKFNVVAALINNGYAVWVVEDKDSVHLCTTYWVCYAEIEGQK